MLTPQEQSRFSGAKQIGSGELSLYDNLAWKDFSRKLGGLGYQQVNEVPVSNAGSLHILSRQNYSPPSFLPRNELVNLSSAAMVKVNNIDGQVGYLLITKQEIRRGVEELASDAEVMGRYFISQARTLETSLLPNPLAILGVYAAIGLSAGVALGELLQSQVPDSGSRYGTDVAFGILSSMVVTGARIMFERKVRQPLLRRRAASQMDVSSYLFGSEAITSVDCESRAQQFEAAASLVHTELRTSGVAIDPETFYRAFRSIQELGVDETERIVPVTKVPLEKIVQVIRAHPGILPA